MYLPIACPEYSGADRSEFLINLPACRQVYEVMSFIFPIHYVLLCSFKGIIYGLLWGYKHYYVAAIIPVILVGIDQPVIAGVLQGAPIY